MRKIIFIILIAAFFPAMAADHKYTDLAKNMFAAFTCGEYATVAGKTARAKSLYKYGISSGHAFLGAVKSGKITNKDFYERVPIGISFILRDGGPSDDFVLGRIFESITMDVAEGIIQRDSNGIQLPMKEWRLDEAQKKIFAQARYAQSNCWAIGPSE